VTFFHFGDKKSLFNNEVVSYLSTSILKEQTLCNLDGLLAKQRKKAKHTH